MSWLSQSDYVGLVLQQALSRDNQASLVLNDCSSGLTKHVTLVDGSVHYGR
jgi:hypothetical protein